MSILDPHPPRVTPSEIAYLTLLAVKICIFAFLQKYKNAKFMYPTPPFSQFACISSMQGQRFQFALGEICLCLYPPIPLLPLLWGRLVQVCPHQYHVGLENLVCVRRNLPVSVFTYPPSAITLGQVSLGKPHKYHARLENLGCVLQRFVFVQKCKDLISTFETTLPCPQ